MHIGIIMDGNRRWAKKNLIETTLGHHKGHENLINTMKLCPKKDIDILSVYALSTENLKNRSKFEVAALLKLIEHAARSNQGGLKENNVKIKILGDISLLPEKPKRALQDLVDTTRDNMGILLQLCINYGGRDELVRGIKKLVATGGEINEENISKSIDSSLEPDLIIRTGGDIRTSNFLLWQAAYSEYYFTDVLWPDFNEVELDKAIEYLKSTKRNFGK